MSKSNGIEEAIALIKCSETEIDIFNNFAGSSQKRWGWKISDNYPCLELIKCRATFLFLIRKAYFGLSVQLLGINLSSKSFSIDLEVILGRLEPPLK